MSHHYDSPEFAEKYTYRGDDLGALWSKEQTRFRLWAPTAENAFVRLYRGGDASVCDLIEEIPMHSAEFGTWTATRSGDLNGIYYTYVVTLDGKRVEACDPYARTTGVNGLRAMVLDLSSTNPAGWDIDRDPHYGIRPTDMLLYEAHIRDLTIDASAGSHYQGKFLGVAEMGTHTQSGIPTGIDHIRALGATHLHLLPMYDYGSVDESKLDEPQFNWGYDPVNYNVPEGSYATDPYHGEVRVREMKQMIRDLHRCGISVVMDVVYNHVYDAEKFCFNELVPMYFSRQRADGTLLNDSGCGNDTASERPMVRKFIVDSVKYWAEQYHIDGFRFDLVGLIDVQTIREVIDAVHETCPNVIFYGEGWDMYTGAPQSMATQKSAPLLPKFAFFNDIIRDTLRGDTFHTREKGFVSGQKTDMALLADCYAGKADWLPTPAQSVNYVSCHDNNTLFDRICIATPNVSRARRIRMSCLAATFSLTAQGIPFMQAGEEFLRSKPLTRRSFVENSFRSPDSVNSIKWSELDDLAHMRVLRYYQGLIELRNALPALRDTAPDNRTAIDCGRDDSIAFAIGDDLLAIFNAGTKPLPYALPEGKWDVLVSDLRAGATPIRCVQGDIHVRPISAMILKKHG